MELFGRELSLEQMVGFVECQATPDEDLVHRAALEIVAALRETQRRADAAVEDLNSYARFEKERCAYCIHDDECEPGEMLCSYNGDTAFEWRGPQEAEKGEAE